MNLDATFAAARKRLDEYINRVVGQKLRRMREADQRAKADAERGTHKRGAGAASSPSNGSSDGNA